MKAKDLLSDRRLWIGCAMLWIVWYHLGSNILPYPLSIVGSVGYGGVDICVFASGIGCFFSLSKSTSDMDFYKRRFMRIMPSYFCFIVFWILFRMCTQPLEFTDILGNFFAVQAFTERGNYFNWYISLIILLYLLSPLFYALAGAADKKRQHIPVVLVLLLLSVAFWDTMALVIIFTRFPIFYIGMVFARFCANDGRLEKKDCGALIALALVGAVMLALFYIHLPQQLWSKGLHWYPFILISPGLCLLISLIRRAVDRWRFGRALVRAIEKVGDYSLELYLTHIFIIDAMAYIAICRGIALDTYFIRLSALAVSVAATLALRWLTSAMLKLFRGPEKV